MKPSRRALRLDRIILVALFVVLTMVTGFRLAVLTPIGQVADEPAHIARAAALLHGQLLGQRVPFTPPGKSTVTVPAVRVDYGLLNASIGEMGASCAHPGTAVRTADLPWTRNQIIDIDYNTVQYFPALYLPGTIGIAIGRLLGQRPLAALFSGRIGMLLAYVLIGALAVGVARFGAGVIFATLSLPMALSLGASFNQDGLLIALSALAGAILTIDPVRHPKTRWWFLPIFMLVIASKPPYGLLLFMALTPLAAPHRWRRAFLIAIWGIPPLIWVVVMAHVSLMPYLLGPYKPGPLWPGQAGAVFTTTAPLAQLRVLTADPLRIVTLTVGLLIDSGGFLIKSGIGMLGWLTVDLARWAYVGWGLALAAAGAGVIAARASDGARWNWLDSVFSIVLVSCSVIAIELAVYLSWDKVGSAVIYGPQGRYYLLFLPFLMLAIPRLGGRFSRVMVAASVVPAVIMAVIDMFYLPGLMAQRFCLG
ncbi:DUF2142 domain-containing protein [Acidiphilium acidophilum]|uniref:DUF2142 domain-containing protein n=1 Tax=Acidiphilium acidophilum TaxID=76588 RepID=A0AAW9DSE7_ACIAO|nr:DUF2142 domain-containing protein [Acidiphilium acidophilum]MDX5930987.1 DUF2142 domain-containing protein [Acidiphilium acidophilum]GBQ21377.1 hypothetical protein AA700_1397 [Acidiphilium acidophilum DSM 700]